MKPAPPGARAALACLATLTIVLAGAACSGSGSSGKTAPRPARAPGSVLGRDPVGRRPDGTIVTPSGQVLSPAGAQVEFPGRPVAVAVRPGGRTAAVMSGTSLQAGSSPLITVVDLDRGAVVQQFTPPQSTVASFSGLVYSADGNRLYASALNAVIEAAVDADGRLSLVRKLLPEAYPTGLALSPDGSTLYAGLSKANAVAIIDLATGAETARVRVGNAPRDLLLAAGKLYVANEGGRVARPGDFTNESAGTPIVADRERGAASTGSVSIVNLADRSVAEVMVELHPTALAVRGRFVFVANTDSDSVSVIDTTTDREVETFAVAPNPAAGGGSAPNALAFLPDGRLAVSLGRDNAVGVYRWRRPSQPVPLEGLVPTGWYPAGVAVDAQGGRLVVANANGVGTLGPQGKSLQELIYDDLRPRVRGHTVTAWRGSASVVAIPGRAELDRGSARVARNNGWDAISRAKPRSGAAAVPVPERIGEPSPIKKVVYVIKENRTYDQVLGDDARGNGDPSLVQFGPDSTPNHHAIARQWVLFDNFYSAGSVSADGHQWVTQADDPDYVERMLSQFPGGRSYPSNGGDPLAYLPSGFLWENARRHGRTVQVFGEYAEEAVTPATSDIPSLDALLVREYPPFNMAIPDQERADVFLRHLARWQRSGSMPDLVIVHLPNDHTTGTTPGFPTTKSQVADNDLALGRILEGLSGSRFWKEMAVFAVEDDAQFGVDHVDGHRTIALLASPYTARGKVDSTFYNQVNLVRTIEQILGLPPMNRMDVAAAPMRSAFVPTANPARYRVRTPTVVRAVNREASSLTGIERAWAVASARMDFSVPDVEANRAALNRAIWYSTKGFDVPYPGDGRVLRPAEVPDTPGDDD